MGLTGKHYQFKIQYHKFTLWPSGDVMTICASDYIFPSLTKNSILRTLVKNLVTRRPFSRRTTRLATGQGRGSHSEQVWTGLLVRAKGASSPSEQVLTASITWDPQWTDKMTAKPIDRHKWKHYFPQKVCVGCNNSYAQLHMNPHVCTIHLPCNFLLKKSYLDLIHTRTFTK